MIFDLWLYSGDESLLNKYKEFVLDATARYLKMIAPDGTVHFEGYAFLDWPSSDVPEEVNAGLHGLLSLALEASCNMYKHWQLDTAEIEAALSKDPYAVQIQELPQEIPGLKQAEVTVFYDDTALFSLMVGCQEVGG